LSTNDKQTIRQPSDEILITWVAQGDPAALETLYDRYAAIILGVCLRLLHNRTTAENVLQEIFWQVWERAASYQAWNGPFTGWLFRIARELAREVIQKSE
jgi:RNA polymerase sigma-70 factor, ECF subfamily